jgi:hypothetical protein
MILATGFRIPFGRPAHSRLWLIALVLVVDIVWLGASGRSVALHGVLVNAAILGGLTGIQFYYERFRDEPRIVNTLRELVLLILFSNVAAILSYLVVSTNAPVIDARLAAWDRSLGLDWTALFNFVQLHPALHMAFHIAYQSTLAQIVLAVGFLGLTGQAGEAREFVGALMASSLIAIAISGPFPATSTFIYYHVATDIPWISHFFLLRAGGLPVIDLDKIQGLISMPSYHCVMSLLLIHAMRRSGPLLPVAAVANVIVILSTPTQGGHYFVDVLAGAVVAAITIALLRGFAALRPATYSGATAQS